MNLFKKKKQEESSDKEHTSESDKILDDFPRGVEGRRKSESWLPKNLYETPERIAEQVFMIIRATFSLESSMAKPRNSFAKMVELSK